jgi:L-threonylcarbamoyladenylate synthase
MDAGWKASADPGEAADLIRRGGVLIYPTETVYGLGAGACNAAAIERIARIKGTAAEAAYLLLVRDIEQIRQYARIFPAAAERLARRFWPGPLTLILPAKDGLPPRLVGAGGGVGVRISSHPWCQELLSRLECALVSTSANFSGQPAAAVGADLDPSLKAAVDLVVDGGRLRGRASTVLDLCSDPPRLLREGEVSGVEIEAVIGKIRSG